LTAWVDSSVLSNDNDYDENGDGRAKKRKKRKGKRTEKAARRHNTGRRQKPMRRRYL